VRRKKKGYRSSRDSGEVREKALGSWGRKVVSQKSHIKKVTGVGSQKAVLAPDRNKEEKRNEHDVNTIQNEEEGMAFTAGKQGKNQFPRSQSVQGG